MLFVGGINLYQEVTQSTLSKANHVEENHFVHVKSLNELQEHVERANAQNKTVMVDLYADWCIACKEFEKYTFPTPEVQNALANSVLVQIDLTDMGLAENKEIMKHFNVFGLPSILFFDLQGKELSQQRVTGFMESGLFANHINTIFKQ